MSKFGDMEHKSAERLRFRDYLRTGRWIEIRPETELERKFNPYHDPDNGRFTFAPGHARAPSNVIISKRRDNIRPAGGPRRNSEAPVTGSPKPYLSELHNELNAVASKYPPRPGTREWTALDAAAYLAGKKNIHAFKAQWVRGYRDAIKAAAQKFDLPPPLLAGVAFAEVGGDPLEIDDLAYTIRTEQGRGLPLPGLRRVNLPRDLTSFGNVSVQVRRAAQSLGYGTDQNLSDTQRRSVIDSLKVPSAGLFIAAKHLADLRDIDAKGRSAGQLTASDIAIMGARYNQGPDVPRDQLVKDLSYGRNILKRWRTLGRMLEDNP